MSSPEPAQPDDLPGALHCEMPRRISPMLATLTEKPFNDPKWFFEPKLDGYRIIAFVQDGQVRLQSRNFQDYTSVFPEIVRDLALQPVKEAVFDGELVALDAQGRPCFQCLQGLFKPQTGRTEIGFSLRYFVFDLLYLDGYDLTGMRQEFRSSLLDKTLQPGANIKSVSRLNGDAEEVFQASVAVGMEGIIAKHRDAVYRPGRRSPDWLKIKSTLSDDFVVAGFTPGQGNRTGTFGALVLGQYDAAGHLKYRGNVGTGFNEAMLRSLKEAMERIKATDSPFDEGIIGESGIKWLKPELVVEVKYAEITTDGALRAPVFLRLRDDKPAAEVIATHSAGHHGDNRSRGT
ncbi:MAG: non-homologous end-joining DNA ligase [Dehalogenimonas sp.]